MPELQELVINYSVGIKANIGNYESADAHLSKTEKWNVQGLTAEEAAAFYDERYEALHEDLGAKIEIEYANFLGSK